MKTSYKALLIASLLVGCSSGSDSDLLSWEQPDEAYRIGRGYNPNVAEPVRGDCLLNPEALLITNWVDAQGVKAEVSETRITSKENLYKELNLTANAKVKYGAFSGSGSYSQYEKFTSSEESFTWLYSLKAAIGTKTLKTEEIDDSSFKPEARRLIAAARAGNEAARKSFYTMCGTQFIRSVRLGGAITDVLEISAKASDQVKEISAKLKASYGSGSFGVSGNASYASIFNKAEKNSFFKREYSQTGGKNIEFQITDTNVKEVTDQFVRDLKDQNAAVIEVEMIDWNTVIDFSPGDPVDVARSIRIDQLLRQLWRYQDTLYRIDSYIYLYDQGIYDFSAADIAKLRKAYTDVTDAIDSIIALGRSCYADAVECSKAITQVIVTLPKPAEKSRGPERLYATANWSVLFPSTTANLYSESSSTATVWAFDEDIAARTLDGAAAALKVELAEVPCSSVAALTDPQNKNVFATFEAEPVYYTESFRTLPNGKKILSAVFAVKSNGQCLRAQIHSAPLGAGSISVSDGSGVSSAIKRLISSIKKKGQ